MQPLAHCMGEKTQLVQAGLFGQMQPVRPTDALTRLYMRKNP